MSKTILKATSTRGRKAAWVGLVGLTLTLGAVPAFAQAPAPSGPGGAPGGPGGPGGGRGGFDPQQFRQMMMDRLKEQLGATDDEWKALQPRIEKVMDAQRESMGGMSGMAGLLGFRGRGGPDGGNANPSPLAKAAQDLQAATSEPNTDAKEYAKKMAAFRDARDKARQNLAQAQKDLKDLLTAKQEAVLLSAGLVD